MKHEIVDALIASLNDPNAGWNFDKYYARNERIKCTIWLANGAGWLDVDFYGPKIFNRGGQANNYRAGGTLLFHPIWARRVYNAARPHQRAAVSAKNEAIERKTLAAIRSASTQIDAEVAP